MATSAFPRFAVLGTGVDALSLEQATEWVLAHRVGTGGAYACLVNAHGVMEARRDMLLREAYERASLCTPDGMPLVWIGKLRGHGDITRVYGPDLMLAVCDQGRAVGLRHYFYGGSLGVAGALAKEMLGRFPGLQVVGWGAPPFRDLRSDEFETFRADIAQARPDVLWVGIGAPRQERFMAAHWRELEAGVLIGVGAAFDFHTGRVRQAPRWMQRSGLEWFYRFCREPRRLARRYLIGVPAFAFMALCSELWRICTGAKDGKAVDH